MHSAVLSALIGALGLTIAAALGGIFRLRAVQSEHQRHSSEDDGDDLDLR
jgi:hypothetical protein